MLQNLLQIKYKLARETIKNLAQIFDKENADYNLHSEIGNSLSLTYGISYYI
jgi:hypothetical protein